MKLKVKYVKKPKGAQVVDRLKFLAWLDYLLQAACDELGIKETTLFMDVDDNGRLVMDRVDQELIETDDGCFYTEDEVFKFFREKDIPYNTGNPLSPGQAGSGSPGTNTVGAKIFGASD